MSIFEIYLNGELIKDCNFISFKDKFSILSTLDSIYFSQNIYPPQICPYAFINSNIEQIFFNDITNTFLVKNRLNFINLNNSLNNIEMTKLKLLGLNIYYESLTRSLINPQLFKGLENLMILGNLVTIDTDIQSTLVNP